jgi:hypothetical protein
MTPSVVRILLVRLTSAVQTTSALPLLKPICARDYAQVNLTYVWSSPCGAWQEHDARRTQLTKALGAARERAAEAEAAAKSAAAQTAAAGAKTQVRCCSRTH